MPARHVMPGTQSTNLSGETRFIRGLGLLDSTMLVAGSMIGSGIFIVSAGVPVLFLWRKCALRTAYSADVISERESGDGRHGQ